MDVVGVDVVSVSVTAITRRRDTHTYTTIGEQGDGNNNMVSRVGILWWRTLAVIISD